MPPAQKVPGARTPIRWSTAVVAGLAFFLVVIGLISSGPGGGLIMAALVALATGLYTAVTRRPSWARLPGRKAGAITAGAAVVALLVGAAIVPSDDTVPTAVAEQTEQPEPSSEATPSSTPSATATTAKATPTPSETADVAPLDAETVPGVDGNPSAPQDQPAADTTALALLETLPIKGRAPKTGYSREEFGPAWADVDSNGCDTRNDMLKRDLTELEYVNSVPCKVQSGTLDDPYTGTIIAFERGQDTSSKVQIDHVVALSDAWQKGAQQLTADQRLAFANDPLNLQSADGPANQQKGDGDAATWLPPNRGYRCEYVARQVSVKATYTLWVTQGEHDAMEQVLSDCNGILAPTDQKAPPAPSPTQTPTPTPAPVETQAPEAPVDVFANCTEAANAGYSDMVMGSPGYSPQLDSEGDGVACESAPAPAPPAPAPAPVVPAPVAPAPVAPAPVAPAPVAPEPYYQNCDAVRAAGAAPIYPGQPGFQPKFDGNSDGVGCE